MINNLQASSIITSEPIHFSSGSKKNGAISAKSKSERRVRDSLCEK